MHHATQFVDNLSRRETGSDALLEAFKALLESHLVFVHVDGASGMADIACAALEIVAAQQKQEGKETTMHQAVERLKKPLGKVQSKLLLSQRPAVFGASQEELGTYSELLDAIHVIENAFGVKFAANVNDAFLEDHPYRNR